MNQTTINQLHREKNGKVGDKWASYLTYYDVLFKSLCHQSINLLEIDVQNGGFVKTWPTYFTRAQLIIGCDIDPKCGMHQYADSRIHIVVGEVNAGPAFQAIRIISTDFDIVIDDGSHQSMDILNSSVNYFPILNPGGVYVVEDTHTLYKRAFGGGLLDYFAAYAFFNKLVDVVNFKFWREDCTIPTHFSTFFPQGATGDFILEGWIDSISLRHLILTITKALPPNHNKLWERVLVGNSAPVQN